MKIIILLLLAILCFDNCKSKNGNFLKNKNFARNELIINEYNMDTIRKFDINRYCKYVDCESLEYKFVDTNGYDVRQIETPDLFIEYIQEPNKLFHTYNEYNKKGDLMKTGLRSSNGGFQYGVWKFYDELGNLIQEIDYEKTYKFTWEKVLDFIKKENIDLNEPITYITRVNSTIDGKYWRLSWNTKDYSAGKPLKTVLLDGDTGKVLSEKYYEIEE